MFSTESNKFLICGLGNIGAEYANTRHNIGFSIVDAMAISLKTEFTSGRLASIAKARLKGRSIIIIKPNTYMNLSGKAMKYWIVQEKIPIEQVLVIVDDIALPLGNIRLKKKGGDAGHNGLNNIILNLQSEEFPRLRFGIGSDFAKGYQVDFVLGRWTKAEETILAPQILRANEAIKSFVLNGIDITMNQFNQ